LLDVLITTRVLRLVRWTCRLGITRRRRPGDEGSPGNPAAREPLRARSGQRRQDMAWAGGGRGREVRIIRQAL